MNIFPLSHLKDAPLDAFTQEMEARNLVCNDAIVIDGTFHRFHVAGDKPGSRNGWYILHEQVSSSNRKTVVGSFGSWKTGDTHNWSSFLSADSNRTLTEQEHRERERAFSLIRAAREKAQQEVWQEAAESARKEWEQSEPANPNHPYLLAKRVKPHGIRQRGRTLLIPVYGDNYKICSLQYIWQDEQGQFQKRFKSRGRKVGGFHSIGRETSTIYIAEGYATAATIHEITQCLTIVAFDSGNLPSVAQRVRAQCETSGMIIAADNDAQTEGNPGMTAAMKAANAVGARVVHPTFPPHLKGTDFNDLHHVAPELTARQLALPSPPQGALYEFTSSLEMIETPKPVDWLIKGFLETDSLAMVFGSPGCGKSFLAVDLACSVASNLDWHGHKVKKPGPVFYIAGEGHNGITRRLKAWYMEHPAQTYSHQVHFSKVPASLMEKESANQLCESIKHFIEQRLPESQPPALIIIDTLARNFGAGDENSTKDMSQFILHLDTYLRGQWQCCVLVVHHTGVAETGRARGNSALKGALDAEYLVVKDGTHITVKTKKMKDAQEPDPLEFELEQIQLPWTDDDGDIQSSAVLVETQKLASAANRTVTGVKMGVAMHDALKALEELYREHREMLIASGQKAEGARVLIKDWRKRWASKNDRYKPNNFPRTRKSLMDKELITLREPYVYLCSNPAIGAQDD